MKPKKFMWRQYSKNEWQLVRVYGGVYDGLLFGYDELLFGHEVAATAYRYLTDFGWKGVVSPTQQHPDKVLFLEPDNLVDMKLLLETTVALRENSNGV